MKIVVLSGGLSPERNVSLSSGTLIANALIESGHYVCLLDVYKGTDINNSNYDDLFYSKFNNKVFKYDLTNEEPDLDELKKECKNGDALIGKNVINICKTADIVFIALHGAMGENGQLQATFDTLGIKYTGSGYVGCVLAMNKVLTKQLLVNEHIDTANWVSFNFEKNHVKDILNIINFPCVVKPCSCGSSVGVSIVSNENELNNALDLVKKYENTILIEEFIKGREFSVGILGNTVLPPIEIKPKNGFYDYKNKYQTGLTEEICPAKLSNEENDYLANQALKVHNILKLGSYSRIDFIYSNKKFYCLEANTLPGMTPNSLLPQEAKALGINYLELCNKIISISKKVM